MQKSEQRIMGQEPFCCSGNNGILFRFKIVSSRIAECRFDGMRYLYDHSGITMNTCGFSCPWDSGQVGWIYADKAMIEQEHGKITPEILEKVRQTLEAEVKEYDYYLTNQCYGFQLFKEDVEVDSCWGFLGEIRDVQDAVKEYLPEDCNPAIVESLQFQIGRAHV